MIRKIILIAAISLIFISLAAGSEFKNSAKVSTLKNYDFEKLIAKPHFATAATCSVRHDHGAYWAIQHWVTGAELYKSFQNPAQTCTGPYPFTVQEVYMIMYFETLCTLNVSVDVEAADMSNSSCPVPGALLALSSEYAFVIPAMGLYMIAVPIDTPYVVNNPYFAGFYISNPIDSSVGAAMITDSIPVLCTGYNIWDTAIGFIDVADNGYFNFPGRMLLYSGGTTGGGGGSQPVPSITLLKPSAGEAVSGQATVWASETSGSTIIDYVKFDRKTSGNIWTEIGRDSDGSRALRNGIDPSGFGDGYTVNWNYAALTEGAYWLRATAFDTLGRSDADSHQVSIDPTPPDLVFTDLASMDTVCPPVTLAVTSADQNINQVTFEKKAASTDYTASVALLNQSKFGNNYCGPVAGAIAVKYWFDKGFIYSMREGSKYISLDTVAERLAANMRTVANDGTFDDLFYGGLLQYTVAHGNELQLNFYRRPNYWLFRTLFQERELLAVLALSGSPGVYLVAIGVSGFADTQGRFPITVSDPLTGTLVNCFMKNTSNGSQLYYRNSWHDLDAIITVMGYSHTVNRDLIGTDISPDGGWSYDWTASDLVSDSLYYVTATSTDAAGQTGTATSLVRYKCQGYTNGDYNGDGLINIGDIILLSNFIYRKGPAPAGGAYRADVDCNGEIDISDVIIIIRYLFLHGTAPCH